MKTQLDHPLRIVLLATLLSPALLAATPPNWPQFRGPDGSAVGPGQSIPLEFGPDKNVRWKVPVSAGYSSPCIWGDRIFLTGHTGTTLEMICLNRANGSVLWKRERTIDKLPKYVHKAGGPANSTPATDGRLVFFYFDDHGLVATETDGTIVWEKNFPVSADMFGYGASPILDNGRIYLNREGGINPGLFCLEAATGNRLWRAERPAQMGGFSTPIIWSDGGQRQILVSGEGMLKAYETGNGNEVWHVTGLPQFVCPSPVAAKGMVVVGGWTTAHVVGRTRVESVFEKDAGVPARALEDPNVFFAVYDKDQDGRLAAIELPAGRMSDAFPFVDADQSGFVEMAEWAPLYGEQPMIPGRNVMLGIAPGGRGNLTDTHVKWETKRGLPYVASPMVYRDRVYFVKAGGYLSCLDLYTGKAHYQAKRLGIAGEYYATPVAAGNYIIVCPLRGTVLMIEADDELKIAARNALGEEISATPAVVDNTLYLRGHKHLWAFAD